ncbi:toll/interleukin-1 receptor domain-containing protein [Teredinibacter purpureus]|uniref:toll/interleukin-1 receptor domain-containing protein n=1 Tax=Teredinibacter purpureus TaxID=2731756 RepID=UPI0005F82F01|nr:toll/interleukin-1 receptor domain-containing protein [Teredinibacter purpureus]
MSQVFLSYSRKNLEDVLRIRQALERRGIDVWIDQDDIGTGSRWDVQIEEGIQKSRVVVVILSDASVASSNVGDEWSFAIENDKHIIPVLLHECNVPMRIASLQRIEFTDSFEKGIGRLVESILDDKTVARKAEKRRRSFQPHKVLALAKVAALIAIVLGGGYGGYTTYQNHWSHVVLDEALIGQPREIVESKLSDQFVSVDMIYIEHVAGKAGTVFKLTPAANTSIKRFSDVALHVVANKIEVPNVMSQTEAQAVEQLEALGLVVSLSREANADVEVGHVFSMSPESGSTLTMGAKIEIIIAEQGGWIYLEKGRVGEIVTLDSGFKLRRTTDSSTDNNIVDRLRKGTPVKIDEAFENGWRRVRVINAADV